MKKFALNQIQLLFSFSFIFFVSCKVCHEYDYPAKYENILPTAEDLTWVNFNDGDSLFFKNNLNQFDTMVIGKIGDYGSYESTSLVDYGPFNSCETYKYPIRTVVFFQDTIHFLRGPALYSPNSNSHIKEQLLWSDFNNVDHALILTNPTFNSININGTLYDNVYVQSFDTSSVSTGFVWQVFYQKEIGLLRFDQLGGIRWERVN